FEEMLVYANEILLLGDFNIPDYILNRDNNLSSILENFSKFLNLRQYSNVKNYRGKVLDLVFCSQSCDVSHDPTPLITEDAFHPALYVSLNITNYKNDFPCNTQDKIYNFKKANFQELYQDILTIDWSFLRIHSD